MAYEQKEGQGSLFKNQKKTDEKHPDYKGDCLLNGKKMQIAAWIKEAKNGSKFMSLRIKEDNFTHNNTQQQGTRQAPSDEIPM